MGLIGLIDSVSPFQHYGKESSSSWYVVDVEKNLCSHNPHTHQSFFPKEPGSQTWFPKFGREPAPAAP